MTTKAPKPTKAYLFIRTAAMCLPVLEVSLRFPQDTSNFTYTLLEEFEVLCPDLTMEELSALASVGSFERYKATRAQLIANHESNIAYLDSKFCTNASPTHRQLALDHIAEEKHDAKFR